MKMYDICRGLGLFKRSKGDNKNSKEKGKDPKSSEKNNKTSSQNKPAGKHHGRGTGAGQVELSYVTRRAFDPWNQRSSSDNDSDCKITIKEDKPCVYTYLPRIPVDYRGYMNGSLPRNDGGVDIGSGLDTSEFATVDEHLGQSNERMVDSGGSRGSKTSSVPVSIATHHHPSYTYPRVKLPPRCESSGGNDSCLRLNIRNKAFHYYDRDNVLTRSGSQSGGVDRSYSTTYITPSENGTNHSNRSPRDYDSSRSNANYTMEEPYIYQRHGGGMGGGEGHGEGKGRGKKGSIRRRATMAGVADYKERENGRRFTCIERNRFLQGHVVPPLTLQTPHRPSRRDSDRKRQETGPPPAPESQPSGQGRHPSSRHHHQHHPQQHPQQHQTQHQHQEEESRHKRHHSARPLRSSSARNSERRKTLGSLDAKEVTMLTRASKVLTEHVKDMTEKTKSTCCTVVNNRLAEKENVITNNMPPHSNEPQNYITDHSRATTYQRGRLLGKGGFAKCYELTDIHTGKCYAGKIISKSRLSKPHQREKIAREVELHKRLKHAHVVGFHSYFEDNENVYIVLEYCSRKSLVHVLKNRKTVTEPEVRYYLKQLVEGCRYIHNQRIIHRDLKLGNMLLNEDMQIKIADFGLATRVEYDGEKKMTVCGTPNYIAPEVLQKKGHSYEADIWAMGCVMYALLLGRPPFETTTLKETYVRITSNSYSIPSRVSPAARNLIQSLLINDPAQRPSLDKILQHEFITGFPCPTSLPTSACDVPLKFQQITQLQQQQQQQQQLQRLHQEQQRPKSYASPVSATEAMQKITSSLAQLRPQGHVSGSDSNSVRSRPRSPSPLGRGPVTVRTVTTTVQNPNVATRNPPTGVARPSSTGSTGSSTGSEGSSCYGSRSSRPNSTEIKALPIGSSIRLYQLLASCLEQMPDDSNPSAVHNVKPLWVTKWVDYSNKYGFGFQLSDRSVGVLFNDTTRMLLSPENDLIYYNDLSNKVYCFPSSAPPRDYEKKSTLLKYFAQYMDEHLIHGGDMVAQRSSAANCNPVPAGIPAAASNSIFMKKWFRTGKAIVMYLNNGTLQVNFFEDHTKVILSPDGQDYLVTYINTHRQAVTYRLLQFRHFGCNSDIQERLQYARSMLESIINIEGEAV